MVMQESGEQPATRGEARRAAILQAAIDEFSTRGIARASMAKIAAAAGVSRPALYQYFSDKHEIFAFAFVDLFERLVENALAALDEPGPIGERLDEFLQRYEGDLYERMAASPHVDELIAAKDAQVAASIHVVIARLTAGLEQYLASIAPGRGKAALAQRTGWVEMLRLAPTGFRFDQPGVDVFRSRLTTLANSTAAAIDAA